MITLEATICRFEQKGEKSGWRYVLIPDEAAEALNPGVKKSFRIKGTLDKIRVEQVALLPMGDGSFILPLNGALRRQLAKSTGETVSLKIALDERPIALEPDFISCLSEEPEAKNFFQSLPRGHQQYFSKWIGSAKTQATRDKRIAQALRALAAGRGFSEMMHWEKEHGPLKGLR